jgi:hypothetical protein
MPGPLSRGPFHFAAEKKGGKKNLRNQLVTHIFVSGWLPIKAGLS